LFPPEDFLDRPAQVELFLIGIDQRGSQENKVVQLLVDTPVVFWKMITRLRSALLNQRPSRRVNISISSWINLA
jgi:hypothetical protein